MKVHYRRLLIALLLVCLNVGGFTMVANAASKLSTPVVTVSNVASTGKIKLSWKTVKNAKSYKVYRSQDGVKWSCIVTTKSRTLTNTSTVAGKTYYYKVRAIASKSSRNSEYSEVMTATCDLKRPTITLANDTESGKVKVTWKKIDKAVGYEVYQSLDKKTWTLLDSVTGTSYIDMSGKAGKQHYYRVKALAENEEAHSALSPWKYRTCDLAKPVITLENVIPTGKIQVSWNAVEDAKEYKVYNSLNKKTWKLIKTTKDTSVINTSAVAGKKYYYKVRAISTNSSAHSVYSDIKYLTCKKPQKVEEDDKEDNKDDEVIVNSDYAKEVVNYAKKVATWDTAYVSGKTGQVNSKGQYMFDCSGFVSYVLNTVMQKEVPTYRVTANIVKLRNLGAIYNEGYPGALTTKAVKYSEKQPGDVIFFMHKGGNDHCGIYIGDNKFVHCNGTENGVTIREISGFYKNDIDVVRRYTPTQVVPANTVKTVRTSCKVYAEKGNDNSKLCSVSSGTTVTVLFTGNNPDSYNQAYVKLKDGRKGYIYTKNLK